MHNTRELGNRASERPIFIPRAHGRKSCVPSRSQLIGRTLFLRPTLIYTRHQETPSTPEMVAAHNLVAPDFGTPPLSRRGPFILTLYALTFICVCIRSFDGMLSSLIGPPRPHSLDSKTQVHLRNTALFMCLRAAGLRLLPGWDFVLSLKDTQLNCKQTQTSKTI